MVHIHIIQWQETNVRKQLLENWYKLYWKEAIIKFLCKYYDQNIEVYNV